MGLTALWETIKHHEESVAIAQLAEDHHRRHGKPLRIAVDEADWRFNNLTQQQVYAIRETSNEQAFQGIEKAMFYHICRLLTLNIQLIFVFDGPGRPWKRGKRGGGKIDFEKRRLLQDMLKYFGIPWHDAPGEAAAECARLQILGLVDAVWSQDSDCLMFGCELWIRDDRIAKEKGNTDRSKENAKKNGKFVRVVRTRDMKEKYGLDREGLVLFAMLAGGDYDEKGLPQCGPSTALAAVKKGLGQSLCACRNQRDCDVWSLQLALFLRTAPRASNISVPPGFPEHKTLVKYYKPKVSTDAVLLNSSRLNLDYLRSIQESELLTLTSERFNIWGRLYMDWVGPVLFMQNLTARTPTLPKEVVHDIKLTKRRVKKTDDQPSARLLECKLTFSPFGVTDLQREDFEGDRLGHWNGDKETLFDPAHRVECEVPTYWLEKVLPGDVLDPPPPASKPKATPKRKRQADDAEQNESTSTTTKRKRKTKALESSVTKAPSTARASATPRSLKGKGAPPHPLLKSSASATPSRPRKVGPVSAATQEIFDLIELSDSEDEDLRPPPSRTPREIPSSNTSHIVDLGSPEPSDDEADLPITGRQHLVAPSLPGPLTPFDLPDEEDGELQLALRLSMQEQHPPSSSPCKRSKHDRIFAMREAGRDVHGLSVPAWSLDQPTSQIASSPTPRASNRDARTATSYRPAASARDIERPSIPDWSVTSPAVLALPTAAPRPDAVDNAPSSPTFKPTAEEVRAARLRHFVTASMAAVDDAAKSLPWPPVSKPVERAISGYQIPVGADCIDLTDD